MGPSMTAANYNDGIRAGGLSATWQVSSFWQLGIAFLGQMFISICVLLSPDWPSLRPWGCPESSQKLHKGRERIPMSAVPPGLRPAHPLTFDVGCSPLCLAWGTLAGRCFHCLCRSFSEYQPLPLPTPGKVSPCGWSFLCQMAWDLLLWICMALDLGAACVPASPSLPAAPTLTPSTHAVWLHWPLAPIKLRHLWTVDFQFWGQKSKITVSAGPCSPGDSWAGSLPTPSFLWPRPILGAPGLVHNSTSAFTLPPPLGVSLCLQPPPFFSYQDTRHWVRPSR